MNDRRGLLWGLGVGAGVLLIAIFYYAALPKGSNEDQINGVLKDAIAAGRAGKSGSVLDLLSKAFVVNGSHPEMKDVASMIRQYKPDCEVTPSGLSILGDDAQMEGKARIFGSFLGSSVDYTVPKVRLTFRKENSMSWGIVPVQAWKLKEIFFEGPLPEGLPVSGWIHGMD